MNRRLQLQAWVLLLFGWTITFPFIALDDSKHIWQNPYVTHLSFENLKQFWVAPYYGLFVPIIYNVWALLAWLTQFLGLKNETTIIGGQLFHLACVSFHILNIYLCYELFKKIWLVIHPKSIAQESVPYVLFGLLPFAIHPLQVESIAWASGLKDVLSTTLALISLLGWVAWIITPQKRPQRGINEPVKFWQRFPAPTFYTFFILALLAKPNIVVLPVVALLLSFMLNTPNLKKSLVRLAPAFIVGFLVAYATKQAQPDLRLEFTLQIIERPIVAALSLAFYLVKIVIPWPLAPDYGLNPVKLLNHEMKWALVGTLAIFAFYLGYLFRRRMRFQFISLIIFAFGFLPTLGLIPFEFQNLSTVADRYFYFLPAMGLGLFFMASLELISPIYRKRLAYSLIALWSALTVSQASHWRSNEALFFQTVNTNPASYLALNNLGLQFIRAGDFSQAEVFLKKALDIKPDYLAAVANLGVVYFKQQNFNQTISFYTSQLAKLPTAGPGSPATYADMHFNLGAALLNTGQIQLGQQNIEKAVLINPDHFLAHFHLGRIYATQKNGELAKQQFFEALRLQPNDAAVLSELKRLSP